MQRAVGGKTSIWLTAILFSYHPFDLSPTENPDALALHYNQPLLKMSANSEDVGICSLFNTPWTAKKVAA